MKSTSVLALALLLVTSALALAPAAGAIGVEGRYDPCEWLGPVVEQLPGCRKHDEPRCAYDRGIEDGLCPKTYADASCVAYGLWSDLPYGLAHTDLSRSAAAAWKGGASDADTAVQRANVPSLVSDEAVVASACAADARECPVSTASAQAVDVNLLGGLVTADVLRTDVHASLCGEPSIVTEFANLRIFGAVVAPGVYPGTVFHLPGVARVTVGAHEGPYPSGSGYGVEAAALVLETLDPLSGAVTGVTYVSWGAVHVGA